MFEDNDDYDEAADLALEARLKQEAKERLEALKRSREAEEAAQRVRAGFSSTVRKIVSVALLARFRGSSALCRGYSGRRGR
jgi:hypothetical protein